LSKRRQADERPATRHSLLQRAIAGLDLPLRCLDRPVVVGEPCGRVLPSRVSEAAAAIGIGVVGLDLDLPEEIRDRAIIIVIVGVDPSSEMIGAGALWLGSIQAVKSSTARAGSRRNA
jgi:hypothetical protein